MLRFVAIGLTVIATAWSFPAHSYQRASSINYSVSTETVSGYSRTWKDPWDADYYYDCIYSTWDDIYGYICQQFQIQVNYTFASTAGVTNAGQFPSGAFYSPTAATDFSNAVAGFSVDHLWTHSSSHIGQYTTAGVHYAISDIYVQYCPYNFCFPPVYIATYWFYFGASGPATTTVCVAAQSVLDSAAIAVAVGWPTGEPFERAVTMKCDGNPAPGVVTYLHFSDSFGDFYGNATDDPCASQVVWGASLPGRGGDLHSHPKFTTTAQFNRGVGCNGDLTPRDATYLQARNVINEQLSGVDITNGAPGPKYLKTPTGRVTRNDVQVYP
jgi:hypothetical protein